MSDDQIRVDFEKKIKLDKGVYWCDSAQCYMRDAGGGFTVHDRTANHRLEGWQAARSRYSVPDGMVTEAESLIAEKKAFWAGFEACASNVHGRNILPAWIDYKATTAAQQGGGS